MRAQRAHAWLILVIVLVLFRDASVRELLSEVLHSWGLRLCSEDSLWRGRKLIIYVVFIMCRRLCLGDGGCIRIEDVSVVLEQKLLLSSLLCIESLNFFLKDDRELVLFVSLLMLDQHLLHG